MDNGTKECGACSCLFCVCRVMFSPDPDVEDVESTPPDDVDVDMYSEEGCEDDADAIEISFLRRVCRSYFHFLMYRTV